MDRKKRGAKKGAVTIGLGTNPVRWQAQSSKLLNVLLDRWSIRLRLVPARYLCECGGVWPGWVTLSGAVVCLRFPRSSNGRTAAFGAVNRGSNPCRGANFLFSTTYRRMSALLVPMLYGW